MKSLEQQQESVPFIETPHWREAYHAPKLRPTPETDAAWGSWPYAGPGVHANFARKLERERDDAREELDANGLVLQKLQDERDAYIDKFERAEKQLEAIREAIKEAFNSFADDPQSDSVWLMNDRQASALGKLKHFLP